MCFIFSVQYFIFSNSSSYVRVRMWYLNDANVKEAINEIGPEKNAKLQNNPGAPAKEQKRKMKQRRQQQQRRRKCGSQKKWR